MLVFQKKKKVMEKNKWNSRLFLCASQFRMLDKNFWKKYQPSSARGPRSQTAKSIEFQHHLQSGASHHQTGLNFENV